MSEIFDVTLRLISKWIPFIEMDLIILRVFGLIDLSWFIILIPEFCSVLGHILRAVLKRMKKKMEKEILEKAKEMTDNVGD